MKTIFKLWVPLLILAMTGVEAMADIQVTVYGKGGIIVRPDSTTVVCPEWSKDKCADITIEDQIPENGSCISGTLIYDGESYRVEIIEMPNLKKEGRGYSCNGVVIRNL